MEQITAPHRPALSTAPRQTAEMSLVDCLFSMPEGKAVKRMARDEKADAACLEARLSAEMRSLIAARLRSNEG